jgi:hypothetical protein
MICAHAVSVTLKAIPGVDRVDVSLTKGVASVQLKAGNAVRIEELWDKVTHDGFTPKETRVEVRGVVVQSSNKLELEVAGANVRYPLTPDPKTPRPYQELTKLSGETVVVEGVMVPPKGKKAAPPIQATSVRRAARQEK